MSKPIDSVHWFTNRLGIALRFTDVFTDEIVEVPLQVSVPRLGWKAIRGKGDAIYRFVFSKRPVSEGTFDIEVAAPGREYVNHRRIQIELPVRRTSATTRVLRGDYLQGHRLWPTRRLRLPSGQTGIVGRLESGGGSSVESLEVRLFPQGESPLEMPFARSDAMGEFLFTLPWVRERMTGATVIPPPRVQVRVYRPGNGEIAVNPTNLAPEPGQLQFIRFGIP